MLTSTNVNQALPGAPPSEVAFAQGVLVRPNASYELYGVSALFYSGGSCVVCVGGPLPGPHACPSPPIRPDVHPCRHRVCRRHQRRRVSFLPGVPGSRRGQPGGHGHRGGRLLCAPRAAGVPGGRRQQSRALGRSGAAGARRQLGLPAPPPPCPKPPPPACLPALPCAAQVPLNATSCEVESPWGDGGAAQLDEELCAVLGGPGGMREYATSRLMAIWGLGSPLQPPA